MSTWLADFQERNNLDLSNLVRFRGGVGVKHGRETVSHFVGHPVHYLDGREWKPITLAHSNGQFEGVDFGWNGYAVTYKGKVLFEPKSITFNGVARPLNFFRDGHKFVAYVPGVGTYEIVFSEKGVRELLTIPEPLEGKLTFDVTHIDKPPKGLRTHPRRIMELDGFEGNEYLLKKDMPYPLTIDPDYSGTTNDGYTKGNSTTYSTDRKSVV